MITLYEVYINNQSIDVGDDFEIPLTLQVFDITSFGSISSNYSKTIKIPKTDNNCMVLGHSNVIESASTLVYSKLPMRVIKNGLEIISRGWCYISGIDNDFELTVFYGNYDFFVSIENKKLNELNTADIDHNWLYTNIRDSSFGVNAFTKDYIYPLVEWGQQILMTEEVTVSLKYNDGYRFNLESLLPVINLKYLINKIITEAGYVCVDEDSLLDYFDDRYISLINLLADATVNTQISTASVDTLGWPMAHLYPTSLPTWGAIEFGVPTENYMDQLKNVYHHVVDPVNAVLFTRYRVGCKCTLKCHVIIEFAKFAEYGIPTVGVINVGIGVHEGEYYYIPEGGALEDAVSQYTMLYEEEVTITDAADVTVDFEFESDYIAKDYISVFIEIVSLTDGVARVIAMNSASITFNYVTNVAETTGYGYHLTIGKNLPEMLQKDFIKHLFILRNIVMTTNYYDKIIYLKEFDSIYRNLSNAKDWSDKLDVSKQEFKFIPDGFYKRNFFKYGSPDAKENKNLNIGMGYFDIPNENLETSDEFYKSPFDASIVVTRSVWRFPVLQIDLMDSYFLVNGASPRIMIVKAKQFTQPYEEFPFVSEFQEISVMQTKLLFSIFISTNAFQFDLVGLDDFNFVNILNLYYPNMINMLQTFKCTKDYFNLDDTDILNFNHLIPVWIEKYHSYFYVNIIFDYIDNSTQCELIKLY